MNPVRGIYKILKSVIIRGYSYAEMGTAHSRQARSEPEDGASPEAGAVGYPPGAADRTRACAAVGSAGRARYSASEWAYPSICQPGWYREAPSSQEDDGRIFYERKENEG